MQILRMMQAFHDKISELCINHYNSLPKTGKPTPDEWTILSCIVKENHADNRWEVAALGTGSKCIGKSKMSSSGDILNDSHAEIICRRAFLRYLYQEINSEKSEIFHFDRETGKFCLKDVFKFHFFTSCMPCGDAAIFPKQNQSEFGDVVNSQPAPSLKRSAESDNSKVKQVKLDSDIFRTGAKCLPSETRQDLRLSGPEYHTRGAVRTKPGRGDPTLSVSCSDKLAKWCYLGVQGALLSLLLREPIYFSSLTIAGQTPYCEKALSRGIFNRFDPIALKGSYRQNKMVVGQGSLRFEFSKTDSKNPCPSSIVWSKLNSFALEVAVGGKKHGVTKKKQSTKAGRLKICKLELFRVFMDSAKRANLSDFENVDVNKISYLNAKAKAKDYQEAWKVLKTQGFKVWTVKDDSLLQFVID